jgi:hypothetical protein
MLAIETGHRKGRSQVRESLFGDWNTHWTSSIGFWFLIPKWRKLKSTITSEAWTARSCEVSGFPNLIILASRAMFVGVTALLNLDSSCSGMWTISAHLYNWRLRNRFMIFRDASSSCVKVLSGANYRKRVAHGIHRALNLL